jgi:CRISPR system Cascade subunit CasC
MFVELHILQNFAPSCLNRDDTNSPKTCMFGGYRRARLSSQCLKRSARRHPSFEATVGGQIGKRTKRVASEITDLLITKGHPQSDASLVSEALLITAGFGVTAKGADAATKTGETSVLLFVSQAEISAWAEIASEYFEALRGAIDPKTLPKEGATKRALKVNTKKLDKAVEKAIKALPQATKAADVALFGRMVAEKPSMGIDAACQVAHALSTHAVETEMDFFTAVDDLNPKEETGAGMMGIVEFNSACFYRYSLVDLKQLEENLGGDRELTKAAVLGYLQATVAAIPTGKQTSMAAQNPPEYVRVILRSSGPPWSLANAFQKPIRTRGEEGDLMRDSIKRLEKHHEKLLQMYGTEEEDFDRIATTAEQISSCPLPKIWSDLEAALA